MKQLFLLVVGLVAFLCLASAGRGQSFTYELVEGSTITPANGATDTGAPEALSGTFTLTTEVGNFGPGIAEYLLTALNFTSTDFDLTLSSSPQPNTQFESDESYFNANVNVTGEISGAYSMDSIEGGTYLGSVGGGSGPTSILTSELGLAPGGNGLFAAHVAFDAIAIPEPSPFLLFGCAVGIYAILVRLVRPAFLK